MPGSILADGGVMASPVTEGNASSTVGFAYPTGDTDLLGQSSVRFATIAHSLDEYSGHVAGVAASLVPSWTGNAANAYSQLSDITSAHFRQAAETSRGPAAALGRYRDELARCQKESMTATREAQRCLDEIWLQTSRLRSAREAGMAAQQALSAAVSAGIAARAAGPLAVTAATAADADATIAR